MEQEQSTKEATSTVHMSPPVPCLPLACIGYEPPASSRQGLFVLDVSSLAVSPRIPDRMTVQMIYSIAACTTTAEGDSTASPSKSHTKSQQIEQPGSSEEQAV